VISVAVVAIGVTTTGERTVLGAQTGPSEDHQFWVAFLRSLVKRGLKGVHLVISDANEGLRQAIARVLHGSSSAPPDPQAAGRSIQAPGRGHSA
jgi:transposase-like protein